MIPQFSLTTQRELELSELLPEVPANYCLASCWQLSLSASCSQTGAIATLTLGLVAFGSGSLWSCANILSTAHFGDD